MIRTFLVVDCYLIMADIFSKEKRSKIMGLVRGKNTKPEILIRRALHALGYRYRLHDKKLPGTPDIKLTKFKTIIFVNGCFWHGHDGCKHYTVPKTNNEFWVNKIKTNIKKDKSDYEKLTSMGWKVIVIWTCELKKSTLQGTISDLEKKILGNQAHK